MNSLEAEQHSQKTTQITWQVMKGSMQREEIEQLCSVRSLQKLFVRELKMNGFLEKAGRSSKLLSKQERESKSSYGRRAVFKKSSCGEIAVFNIEAKLEQQGDCQQGFSMTLLPTGGAIYLRTPIIRVS